MTYSPNDLTGQPTEPSKIAPAKVLHKLVTEGRSGRLILTDPNDSSIQWCVYFGGGQIHFAGSLMGQRERLVYMLHQASPGLESCVPETCTSDYQAICQYWRSQQLSINWVRQLLGNLTQEALIHFLAIPQGVLKYEASIGLDPLLLSAPLRQIIVPIKEALTQWTPIKRDLYSPFQRPYLNDIEACLRTVWQEGPSQPQLQDVIHLMDKRYTLYEIAYELSIDVLDLSVFLQPLLQIGAIGTYQYQAINVSKRPVVVCIDDSPTIQQFVKLSLESSGYDVLSVLDPTAAIQHLLESQPTLILMDIEMPHMDGYELCRSTRLVNELREIPIVMLTGREGIIDRVRARMAGCTAYLTKPFQPKELLTLVQKLSQAELVPQL